MTPRTFFIILIKLIGINLVLSSLIVIPELISSWSMVMRGGDTLSETIKEVFLLLPLFFAFLLIIGFCIYKTDWLVDKLALDKHFPEEKIGLDIDRFIIVQIAIIVIGGVFFAEALPAFVRQFYVYFGELRSPYLKMDKNPGGIIFQFVRLVIAYVMMTKSRWLTSLVERETQRGKANKPEPEQ